MTNAQAPEGLFLHTLFERLNASGVRYAVMRNHEPLPHSAGGSDLDIVIAPADEALARGVVLEAIRSAGGVPIGIVRTVGFIKVYALGKPADAAGAWWGMCLDFNIGLYFQGLRLLDEDVAWPLQYHHDIPVLADGFAGILGVLKEALNNEIFPVRYAAAARGEAHRNWTQIEGLLAPMGRDALARLRAMLLSDAPPIELREECRKLRQDVVRHAFAQRGLLSVWQRVVYEWTKVRRYLKPSGIVIAILGVDGAGKSTVINAILPALNAATHNAVVTQHLRPTLLPPLSRLKGKTNQPAGPVLDPHGSMPSGKFGSLFRLTYLTLDYLVGYWLWTRPRIAKQPTVVIFDRYAYDMALDPRRFRIGLPRRVAGWFAALAPKPDLIICLHGSPEVIAARKQELPLEETRRQVDALRAFACREPRAVLISTDTSVEETRDKVLQEVCNVRNERVPAKTQCSTFAIGNHRKP
jgi:thymidylate kinase